MRELLSIKLCLLAIRTSSSQSSASFSNIKQPDFTVKVSSAIKMVNFNILALALVFTGQSLAVATRDHVAIRSTAAAWVEANIESLPKDYKSFSGYSLTYRKAIFHRLDEPSRAELWRSHFGSYRASHPNLTPEQNKVLDDVTAFVGSNNLTDDAAKQELARAAEAAFGAEAVEVVATLGPVSVPVRTACEIYTDLVHLHLAY